MSSDRGRGSASSRIARAGVLILGSFVCAAIPIATSAQPATPEAAMAALVEAMREADADGFLALLSRTRPLVYTGTMEEPYRSDRVSYATLSRDFESRAGYYDVLFDAAGDDCWRDVFELTGFQPWERLMEATFRPPGPIFADGRTFVRWRSEDGRWVLAEIAEPGG